MSGASRLKADHQAREPNPRSGPEGTATRAMPACGPDTRGKGTVFDASVA
jgi:hypothetical protein